MARVTTNFRSVSDSLTLKPFTVNATVQNKALANKDVTLNVLTGNLWFDPNGTATSASLKLLAGSSIDLHVFSNLSLISDATTASVQVIVWNDGE